MKHEGVTFGAYASDSLAQKMDDLHGFIFMVSNKVIQFFEGFFELPYPWRKHDCVFMSSVKYSLETPGCATFPGDLLRFSSRAYWRLAKAIAREIAQQWVGNLVTPKWWNEFWVSDCLADLLCDYCLLNVNIE